MPASRPKDKSGRTTSLQPSLQESFAATYAGMVESRQRLVFPLVKKLIAENRTRRLLDFGGGDGAFLKTVLSDGLDAAYHYDRSPTMQRLARRTLAEQSKAQVLRRLDKARIGTVDAVTLIAVWMELPTEAATMRVLSRVNGLLTEGGYLVAVVTHPCFREEAFASYKTDFRDEHYLESGRSFAVDVFDRKDSVRFMDHHWNLSDMSRQLAASGFRIDRLYETSDLPGAKRTRGSPWLVVSARAGK